MLLIKEVSEKILVPAKQDISFLLSAKNKKAL